MSEIRRELGVIENPHFGTRDCGRAVLSFGVKLLHGGSLQILRAPEAIALIEKHDIKEVGMLHGRACEVAIEGNTVLFTRLLP